MQRLVIKGNSDVAQNNIIELNGRQYDAATGALLGESLINAAPRSRADLAQHHGRVIDGFIRKPGQPHATLAAPTKSSPIATPIAESTGPKQMDIKRVASNSVKPHQPERPKTLMRRVVSKPKAELKPNLKTTAPTEMMAKPASSLAKPLEKKMSVTQVNPVRLGRAKHILRSHHIRRFGAKQTAPTQPAAAVQRPMQYATRPVAARPNPAQPQQHNIATVAQNQVISTRPAPTTTDIFEAALAHATSHEQTTPKGARRHSLRHRRTVNIIAGISAFLLIGGFVGYLNMTNIEIRVASARAGFHAELPSYKPTGYALNGGIKTNDGQVAMNFKSGDSGYTITQEPSAWNSGTLLDQTTAEQGKPGQTIQSNGRTIYVYGSNATWVNSGVLYHINSNASLTTDELTNLAISM